MGVCSLYAAFMTRPPDPSRGFTGTRTMFGACLVKLDWIMLDLVFIALGAALFLGALLYARGCAGI